MITRFEARVKYVLNRDKESVQRGNLQAHKLQLVCVGGVSGYSRSQTVLHIQMSCHGQSTSSKVEATSTGPQMHSTLDGLHIRSFQYLKMISPRSSNYERLEGGMGPTRTTAPKRFAWKKFAVVAVVIIGLVHFFGPRQSPWRTEHHNYGEYFFFFLS